MRNKMLAAVACCLMLISAAFVSCKNKNTPEQPYPVKADVSYTVYLSCDDAPDFVTSLDEVALTIHYLDAGGKEQTKPITKDGENVTVSLPTFPATYKFYVTGSLKDDSKEKYNFGISLKKTIQLYMSDGSQGSTISPALTEFGSSGVQKELFVTSYLPKLSTKTLFAGRFVETGDMIQD